MPKAATTSRRHALRLGGAAAVVAVSAPAIAALPSPDAELIRLCDRLVVNRMLEAAAHEASPDADRGRAFTTGPLDAEWFELAAKLRELESPRTWEGARAMAAAAMAEAPRDRDGNIERDDLHTVLSMGCVDFVLVATAWTEA